LAERCLTDVRLPLAMQRRIAGAGPVYKLPSAWKGTKAAAQVIDVPLKQWGASVSAGYVPGQQWDAHDSRDSSEDSTNSDDGYSSNEWSASNTRAPSPPSSGLTPHTQSVLSSASTPTRHPSPPSPYKLPGGSRRSSSALSKASTDVTNFEIEEGPPEGANPKAVKPVTKAAFAMPVLDGVTGLPKNMCANRDVEGFVSLLNSSKDFAGIMQVMYALRTLSGDDETRRRIGVAGGIQAVVQCMVDCKGSEPQHAMLQEMAMWCLWNVAGHQGNRVRLSQSNCISACIEAMKVHPFSPGVQEQACWLLVCVCFDDVHAKQRARLLGAQDLVLIAMINHPHHPGVQQYGQQCIGHLEQGAPNQHEIEALCDQLHTRTKPLTTGVKEKKKKRTFQEFGPHVLTSPIKSRAY
jgi:hypothetical protein